MCQAVKRIIKCTICSQVLPSEDGVRFVVNKEKADKWLHQINEAIGTSHLDAGAAQKLAGRLSWSTQFLFHKLGRAMIKPIFAQKVSKNGAVGTRLRESLIWWSWVLQQDIAQTRL